jgi:DNA-binding GntR family transcriptional regulator
MAMTFETLEPVTRRGQVASALRNAIIAGDLIPGAKITESDLATEFGVSRGPIREAIRELINEGLLVQRPYSGTQVSLVEERTIIEAHGLRKVIECYAFKLCWPQRNEEFRKEIIARHKELQRAVVKKRRTEAIRAEIKLHSLPYEFSQNELLLETWRQLAQKIQLGFVVYRLAGGDVGFSRAHDSYVTLALGDDLDAMLVEVQRHIDLGLKTIRTFFRTQINKASR